MGNQEEFTFTQFTFTQIIDKCLADANFADKLLSDKEEERMSALEQYVQDEEQLTEALGAIKEIVESGAHDSIRAFLEHTDPAAKVQAAI